MSTEEMPWPSVVISDQLGPMRVSEVDGQPFTEIWKYESWLPGGSVEDTKPGRARRPEPGELESLGIVTVTRPLSGPPGSYPLPDRSKHQPQTKFSKEHDWDIGWTEGRLRDGRPFRAEQWWDCDVGAYHLTVFLARAGLETLDQLTRTQLAAFLEEEGLVRFRGEKRFAIAKGVSDSRDNEFWSVNVVLGDSEDWYADSLEVNSYKAPD